MKGKQYTLSDKLTFGKYRGRTIREVMQKDAAYIEWCKKNIEGFAVSEVLTDNKRTINVSFYSIGIEVLNINPWGYRFFEKARSIAEDVHVVTEKKTHKKFQERQLDIAFIS